jgi:hypothetical protein
VSGRIDPETCLSEADPLVKGTTMMLRPEYRKPDRQEITALPPLSPDREEISSRSISPEPAQRQVNPKEIKRKGRKADFGIVRLSRIRSFVWAR